MKYGLLLHTACLAILSVMTAGHGFAAEFGIPTANSAPYGLTAGSDGNLWFIEGSAYKIGRITTAGVITEFVIPTPGAMEKRITAGPDGNLWFSEFSGNRIGRISPTGVITEFVIPSDNSHPSELTTGPDGNLWFSENIANKIARITPTGVITEFALPTSCTTGYTCQPSGLITGTDGNLWFTEFGNDKIARITPTGVITEFATRWVSNPSGLTVGPDGNLWFTEAYAIGRITTTGAITEFFGTGYPKGLTTGQDGNLWFTEGSAIGRITMAGDITRFPLRPRVEYANAADIIAGPYGHLWFLYGNAISRITTSGVITEFALPSADSDPSGLAVGADGNLWFARIRDNKIVNFQPPTTAAPILTSLSLTCPATVAAGTNGGPCTAWAGYDDGSSYFLSDFVSYSLVSSNTSALTLSVTSVHGGVYGGRLLGEIVTTDTPVIVTGSYTENGVTLTATASVVVKADFERIFNWAESVYPQYFPLRAQTQSMQGYTLRFYPTTSIYLGTKDGRVIVHDGKTWNLLDVGAVDDFLAQAKAAGF